MSSLSNPFWGVDVPVSVHSEVTDFMCGSSLKPAGAAIQGPAMAQHGLTPQESEMGPSVVSAMTLLIFALL